MCMKYKLICLVFHSKHSDYIKQSVIRNTGYRSFHDELQILPFFLHEDLRKLMLNVSEPQTSRLLSPTPDYSPQALETLLYLSIWSSIHLNLRICSKASFSFTF